MSHWIEWSRALAGGVLIGASTALFLAFNGRIAGISGIVGGLVSIVKGDTYWRAMFVAGLVVGGVALALLAPSTMGASVASLPVVALAGALVGVGTRLGNGCTSGHGVCGVARLSPRSIAATIVFISTGAIAVLVRRALEGGSA
jgi:uncharacterized membrane protein YedE/YeeE